MDRYAAHRGELLEWLDQHDTVLVAKERDEVVGVGRDLMHAPIDEARDRDKRTMVAAVDGANGASVRFYDRLGFVEVARMPELGAKFGRWLNLVLIQLRLDDRTAPPDS